MTTDNMNLLLVAERLVEAYAGNHGAHSIEFHNLMNDFSKAVDHLKGPPDDNDGVVNVRRVVRELLGHDMDMRLMLSTCEGLSTPEMALDGVVALTTTGDQYIQVSDDMIPELVDRAETVLILFAQESAELDPDMFDHHHHTK